MANSAQCIVKCASGRVMSFGNTSITANTTTELQTQGIGLNQTASISLGNALVGETITHAFMTVQAATGSSAGINASYLFGFIEKPDGALSVPIEGGGHVSACMPQLVRPHRVQVGDLLKMQMTVQSATEVKANLVTYAASGKCSVFQVTAVADTKTEIVDVQTGGTIGQSMAGQTIIYAYATFPNLNGINDDQAGNNFFFLENSQGQLKDAFFPMNAFSGFKVVPVMGRTRIDQNDTLSVTWGS